MGAGGNSSLWQYQEASKVVQVPVARPALSELRKALRTRVQYGGCAAQSLPAFINAKHLPDGTRQAKRLASLVHWPRPHLVQSTASLEGRLCLGSLGLFLQSFVSTAWFAAAIIANPVFSAIRETRSKTP